MKILVILASFNGEKFIKDQIISILNQKDILVEIMVFDDSSSDNTIKILNEFQDDRIKIIKNEVNSGSAAINFLSSFINLKDNIIESYNYIAFSDQDDIWLPYKLKSATEKLLNEKSKLYCSNLILWNENSGTKSIINKSYPQKKFDYLFEGGSAGCTYVFDTNFAIELKKSLLKIDIKNWINFSHDWYIYFFARKQNFPVSIDQKSYILYRIHTTNVHGQLNVISFFAFKEKVKLFYKGWYINHIQGFKKLLEVNSTEWKIYDLYTRNYFTRLYVITKYNFTLMRSYNKAIRFFILSIFYFKSNK